MTYPSRQKRSSDPAAIRGVLVLVVACVIGIVLLANSGDGGIVADDEGTEEAEPTTVPTQDPTTTTVPATPATKPPSEVRVLVLNGTGGRQAFAGRDNRAKLDPLGYTTLDPLDITPRPSAVFFAPGFQADANAVAAAVGLPDAAVQPLPPNPDLPQVAAEANVVVVIGEDQPATTGGNTTSGGAGTGTGASTGGGAGGGTGTGTSTAGGGTGTSTGGTTAG